MKVRAIFRWITSKIKYDVQAFLSGKQSDSSAKAVLKSRCCVCAGYANLFFALAKLGQIEASLIDNTLNSNLMFPIQAFKVGGLGKGGNFGTHSAKGGPHAWNAVRINNEWVSAILYLI